MSVILSRSLLTSVVISRSFLTSVYKVEGKRFWREIDYCDLMLICVLFSNCD